MLSAQETSLNKTAPPALVEHISSGIQAIVNTHKFIDLIVYLEDCKCCGGKSRFRGSGLPTGIAERSVAFKHWEGRF